MSSMTEAKSPFAWRAKPPVIVVADVIRKSRSVTALGPVAFGAFTVNSVAVVDAPV